MYVYVCVAGPASATCAETLRQNNFKGRILVLSKESVLPYDRPKLSKVEKVFLSFKTFYYFSFDALNIALVCSTVLTIKHTSCSQLWVPFILINICFAVVYFTVYLFFLRYATENIYFNAALFYF